MQGTAIEGLAGSLRIQLRPHRALMLRNADKRLPARAWSIGFHPKGGDPHHLRGAVCKVGKRKSQGTGNDRVLINKAHDDDLPRGAGIV